MQTPHAELVYVKSPDVTTLRMLFDRMHTNSLGLYHSDDMSGSLRCVDGMLWFNADISACDSSQSADVFTNLRSQFPERLLPHLEQLLRQCQTPITLGKGFGKLLFKPIDYFEYSGSTLTTILNNTASRCILFVIFLVYDPSATRRENVARVEESLKTCGWRVTMEWCEYYEDVQFLKHSPMFDVTGQIDAVLNLGVILRAMGRCKGDLPGRGSIEQRANYFMRNWVAGLRHAGSHIVINALREKFPKGSVVKSESWLVDHLVATHERNEIFIVSLALRYRCSPGDLEVLAHRLRTSEIGDLITDPCAARILNKDYGLCSGPLWD